MHTDDFILIPGKEPGTFLIDDYTGGPDAMIPDGVYRLNCWPWRSLASLVVAPSVRLIRPRAFAEMTSLRRLTIPDSVETLAASSFQGCTGLREVEVSAQFVAQKWRYCSDELKRGICLSYLRGMAVAAERCPRLENYAVKHRNRLMAMILDDDDAPALSGLLRCIRPPKPHELDEYQARAAGVATTTILLAWRDEHYSQAALDRAREDRVAKQLGEKPWTVADWRNTLRFSVLSGVATITGCREDVREATIPACIGRNAVRIAEGAFHGVNSLRTVYVEDGVEEIPEAAFANCRGLQEVILPPSVRRIGRRAFAFCPHLTAFRAPGVENVGEAAFVRCLSLAEVDMGQRLQALGAYAFHTCREIRRIALPGALGTVPPYALLYCKRLEEVALEEGVEHIGNGAFTGCISMHTVTLPVSLRSIGAKAFAMCRALRELRIPAGVTEIADDAFGISANRHITLLVSAASHAQAYAEEHDMKYRIV